MIDGHLGGVDTGCGGDRGCPAGSESRSRGFLRVEWLFIHRQLGSCVRCLGVERRSAGSRGETEHRVKTEYHAWSAEAMASTVLLEPEKKSLTT